MAQSIASQNDRLWPATASIASIGRVLVGGHNGHGSAPTIYRNHRFSNGSVVFGGESTEHLAQRLQCDDAIPRSATAQQIERDATLRFGPALRGHKAKC